jgi:hypothetical protein
MRVRHTAVVLHRAATSIAIRFAILVLALLILQYSSTASRALPPHLDRALQIARAVFCACICCPCFPGSEGPCSHCWRLPSGGRWCWRCCWVVGHSSEPSAMLLHVNPNHCGSAPCPRAPELCTSSSSSLKARSTTTALVSPRHGVFCSAGRAPLPVRGPGARSLLSRPHRPDRSCARRNLDNNQLTGSLPSSLGFWSNTSLYTLYVVVLSVSTSDRGATH